MILAEQKIHSHLIGCKSFLLVALSIFWMCTSAAEDALSSPLTSTLKGTSPTQRSSDIVSSESAHATARRFDQTPNSTNRSCAHSFGKLTQEGEITYADGVMITGDYYYPLQVVKSNLDLVNDPLKPGQKALDVAAGFSPLAESLRAEGIETLAIDLWYSRQRFPDTVVGRLMKDYVQRNQPYLVTAQAQSLPFEDNSVDVVLSHLLVNNIQDDQLVVAMVQEAYRVLAPGGHLRFHGLDMDRIKVILNSFPIEVRRRARYEMKSARFGWKDRTISISHALLKIYKR